MTNQLCETCGHQECDGQDALSLKWGTLKGWTLHSKKATCLLKSYFKLDTSASAICQHDTPRQKEIICKIIDEAKVKKVHLEWDGKDVSKAKAKEYVMNYGK